MKIKPVESIQAPNYPDKYSSESKLAVQAATPKRWLKVPLAISLSAAVALGLSGCELFGYTTAGEPMPCPSYPMGAETGEVISVNNLFIPLFEFGEGTGSIGCDSVASPSFMSEEEAFAILASAFGEAGLALIQNADTLTNINLPIVDSHDWENRIKGTTNGDLDVHEVSGVPVKFVSTSDIKEWAGETLYYSSVESYPIKSAAQELADKNAYLAVFYDPVTFNSNNHRYTNRSESEELLREQANAFIEWLKTEGLIS